MCALQNASFIDWDIKYSSEQLENDWYFLLDVLEIILRISKTFCCCFLLEQVGTIPMLISNTETDEDFNISLRDL